MSHLPTLGYYGNVLLDFPDVNQPKCINDSEYSCDPIFVPLIPRTNLANMVNRLNHELNLLGYERIIGVQNEQIHLSVGTLVSCVLQVINTHQKNVVIQNNLQINLRQIQEKCVDIEKLYGRCQENLEDTKRHHELTKEQERRILNEKKQLSQRLKITTDELQKMRSNFQRHEIQFVHERRKLEKEIEGLKHRLSTQIYKTQCSNFRKDKKMTHSLTSSCELSAPINTANNSTSCTRFDPKLTNRRPGNVARTLASIGFQSDRDNGSRNMTLFDPLLLDNVQALVLDNKSPQNGVFHLVIRQLENRQHELLHENRELRDLINQFTCRMVRFNHFVNSHCLNVGQNNLLIQTNLCEDENDSLDESDNLDGDDDDDDNRDNNTNRSLGNANELLLTLPYALIRDQLIKRARRISRSLWINLKRVATIVADHRNDQGNNDKQVRDRTMSALSNSIENLENDSGLTQHVDDFAQQK